MCIMYYILQRIATFRFSGGLSLESSVASSKGLSLFTSPEDLHRNLPWHLPVDELSCAT